MASMVTVLNIHEMNTDGSTNRNTFRWTDRQMTISALFLISKYKLNNQWPFVPSCYQLSWLVFDKNPYKYIGKLTDNSPLRRC